MPDLVATIRRRVPSQNDSQYSHWRAYFDEKRAWLRLLREQLGAALPKRRHAVLEIRSLRARLCDYANLVGGAKPIPDALIVLGHLWDDSPEFMTCAYVQAKVPKADELTVITIRNPE